MKDTFYFTHDYNSRTDDKIKCLVRKHGMIGYGLFWAIIEDLYNNANALRTDYEGIAYELRTNENIVKSIIEEFDLFQISDGFFGSLSVQRRLEERSAKSIKAKQSAFKRWNKDANALPTQSECNAIKEKKGNEIKEIDIDEIEKKKKENYIIYSEHLNKIPIYEKLARNKLIKPTEIKHCINEFLESKYSSIGDKKDKYEVEEYFLNWVSIEGQVLKAVNNQMRKLNAKK